MTILAQIDGLLDAAYDSPRVSFSCFTFSEKGL